MTPVVAPIPFSGRTTGVIYLDSPQSGSFSAFELETVESIGRRAGASVLAARSKVDFDLLFSSMIDAIMKSIQAKDVYTRGPSERVRHYSKLLAKELGLAQDELYRDRDRLTESGQNFISFTQSPFTGSLYFLVTAYNGFSESLPSNVVSVDVFNGNF